MAIKIIADSTSYIPKDIQKDLDIDILSLNITLGSESSREVDVDNKSFYEKMKEINEFPKSSQPALGEVSEVFENILKQGNDIVALFISSEMSGTYSSANLIKEDLLEKYPDRKIELIDSRTNCMEMGLAAIEGAKMVKEDEKIEKVVNRVKEVLSKSRFLFTPDTLEYLKMGGRIGSASALFGTILKIRPILTVNNGKTDVVEKVRTKKKAIDHILNTFFQAVDDKGLGQVVVHHINCEDEGIEIANKIKEVTGRDPSIVSIGPVIGAHVGPGAVGVAYFTKE